MLVADHIKQSAAAMAMLAQSQTLVMLLDTAKEAIAHCFNKNGKLLICGNGGSAADAMHIAAEFVVRYRKVREPLSAVALTTDTAILTATANDMDYDQVFARQVLAIGRKDDILLALSTSGQSASVLAAVDAARNKQMHTIGFSGLGHHSLDKRCNICCKFPSRDTALIQQMYMAAAHAIIGAIEPTLADVVHYR